MHNNISNRNDLLSLGFLHSFPSLFPSLFPSILFPLEKKKNPSLDDNATEEMRKVSLEFVIEQLEAFDVAEDEGEDGDEGRREGGGAGAKGGAFSKGGKVSQKDDERVKVAQIDALASWAAHALTGGNNSDCSDSGSFDPSAGPGPGGGQIRVHTVHHLVHSLRLIPQFAHLAVSFPALVRALTDDVSAVDAGGGTARGVGDAAKQRVLVRVLMSAVKLEVGRVSGGGEFLEGTKAKVNAGGGAGHANANANGNGNGNGGKGPRATSPEAHSAMSIALLSALPSLLSKFSSDNVLLRQLAQLPRYLLPSVFSLPNRKKDFLALCKELAMLYVRTSDEKVLNMVALSMKHLCEGGHSRTNEVSEWSGAEPTRSPTCVTQMCFFTHLLN